MEKMQNFLEHTLNEYRLLQNKQSYPKLTCKIDPNLDKDEFSCFYAGGSIALAAGSFHSAVFAINNLKIGVKSGHLAEFLGHWKARFSLRPLWIQGILPVAIAQDASLAVPEYFASEQDPSTSFNERLEWTSKRLIELGYNSIMIGGLGGSEKEAGFCSLPAVLDVFRSYGIKVILKPSLNFPSSERCPLNPSFQAFIKKALSALLEKTYQIDFIFFESTALSNESLKAKNIYAATSLDLVQSEIALLERTLEGKTSLIYYVPALSDEDVSKQPFFFQSLIDELGPNSLLAFSSVAGDIASDHLLPHPLWGILRKSPDVSATRLLPIVNIGQFKQGEGLWPTLSIDIIDRFIGRCYRHNFAGVIGLSGHIPKKETFLDLDLWAASQTFWREKQGALLAETWFLSEQPGFCFPSHEKLFKAARELALELSFLKEFEGEISLDCFTGEECRIIAESVISKLKHLQMQVNKQTSQSVKQKKRSKFEDLFNYFVNDAKKIVAHFLKSFNVPLASFVSGENSEDGFWTESPGGGSEFERKFCKLAFSNKPKKGPSGSRMEKVLQENYGGF